MRSRPAGGMPPPAGLVPPAGRWSGGPLDLAPPSPAAREQLTPSGVPRAGVNLSNFLLVTGRTETGDPVGVSPDMARAFAGHLGVGLELVPYASPGLVADAAARDEWDIALIGAEPQRRR